MGTMMWNLQSRFLVAIQNNDVESVKALLEQGLDPDLRFRLGSQIRPAVCLCVERDHTQLLKVMLQWGCSVNQSDSSGLSALHIAANHGYEEMVAILLKGRARVNAVTLQGHTPLHLASQRHSVEVVRMLVEAGAEVDRHDDERKTPLLNACIQGHAAVADYLLRHKAEANIHSPCGNTPLLFAAAAPLSDVALLSTLLGMGANADCQNRQGETPLHAVLRGGGSHHKPGRLAALDLLLSHRCNVNARTNLGHTPLHLAVLERDDAAALRLVRAGCVVDHRDELGLTPLFYAARDGNRTLAGLLFAAGAKLSPGEWPSETEKLKDPELLEWLVEEGRKCPRLTHMCRWSFRTHYGAQAQAQLGSRDIPATLKRYLSFETL